MYCGVVYCVVVLCKCEQIEAELQIDLKRIAKYFRVYVFYLDKF